MELSQVLKEFNMEESDIEIWYSGLKRVDKNRFFTVNDSVVVELTQSKYMICSWDEKTFDMLMNHIFSTRAYASTNIGNVVCGVNNRRVYFFHQLYLDYEKPNVVDHINRNRFDNRYSNLRITTHQENARNRTIRKGTKSGITGVWKEGDRWRATISDNDRKSIYKQFDCRKYPNAKELVIAWRKQKELEFGYIGE